jgi:cephalosporin hydroxylase
VLESLRRVAVHAVKPLVSDDVWSRLRRVAPRPTSTPTSTSTPTVQPTEAPAGKLTLPQSLPALAKHFGTDKWGRHRYAKHYQTHLKRFRDEPLTLLEIGIGGYRHEASGGASLRMWREYFSRAQIIGLDIYDKSFVNGDRILAYQGSQTDEALLQKIVDTHGPIKIIIDDGSHVPEHIRATFAFLFPLLEDGGVYAIEDTQTSYWPRWGGAVDLDDPLTTMALVKDLVDGLNYEEFGDEQPRNYSDAHVVAVHCYHNLVILEKGSNREGGSRPKNWAMLRD